MDAEGRELQRQFLIDQMYGDRQPTSRVIDVTVLRLRRNLAGTDIQIHSYQTGGYQLMRGLPCDLPAKELLHGARFAG
jgi:DNA-binding response OmpR family regulator